MALGKFLNFLSLRFFICKMRVIIALTSLWELNDVTHVNHSGQHLASCGPPSWLIDFLASSCLDPGIAISPLDIMHLGTRNLSPNTRNNVFWYSGIKFQFHNTTEKTNLIKCWDFSRGLQWQKYNQHKLIWIPLKAPRPLYEICSMACLL